MKKGIERNKRTGILYGVLVITVAVLLYLPAGNPPAKAAERDAPYSLMVYVANEAFVTEDSKLSDVTIKIYKLADQRREAVAETGFGKPVGIREKGCYLVVPVSGEEIETDEAGNAVVTTEDWTYTFGPMMITIPASDPTETKTGDVAFQYGNCTDAVIYAKADRQPEKNSTAISAAPIRSPSDQSPERNVGITSNVVMGDSFPMVSLFVLVAAAVAVAICRKGSGTFTR